MNPKTAGEAKELFAATKKIAAKSSDAQIIVAPPALFLRELVKGYRGTQLSFGAQNIFWEQEGSYTGEHSAIQVADAGATYVIIGHAERRRLGERDDDVRNKVNAALTAKLKPIIAVGESTRDDSGSYVQVVRDQITTALIDVPEQKLKDITIAYEPVWAIGASDAPDAHAVHQMMLLVRKTLKDTYGEKAFKKVRVVYGGAVNDTNAFDILAIPDLSGVLVGRAGLDPYRLEVIARAAHNA